MADAVVILFLAGLVMCWFSSMHVAVGRANPDSERDPLCSCEYYSSETGDKSHLLDFIDDQAVDSPSTCCRTRTHAHSHSRGSPLSLLSLGSTPTPNRAFHRSPASDLVARILPR